MSEVANIPQLRFPEFGDNWEEKKLGNVTSIVMGQSPDSTSYNSNGIGLYLIQGNADIKKRKTLPRVWTDTPTKECKVGDIIMTVRAPVGAVAKSIHNACIGRGVCAIRNNQHSVSNYIYQFLLSFEKKWVKFEQGSTFTAVNTKDVKSLKLILPPVQEQTKIAAFLTAVDNKIEQLSKKQALLGEYKKGLTQQIFSQAIRFKADDGSDFPDWEERKLGDVGKVYQPKTISQTDLTTKGFDVYGANGIIGKYSEYNHEFEQIAVTCRGNTCGTVNFTKPKSWITGNAMVVNVDDSKVVNKTFIYYQLSHTNLTYLITGSGQPQITGDIKTHKVKTPSLPEQTKIANFLSSIDSKIEQVGKQLDESKQFKKALLQQMFV